MAWLLFDNRDSLGTRIYNFNKVLGEKAEQVLAQLTERLDLDDQVAGDDPSKDNDLLEIDLGNADGSSSAYAPLINIFENPDKRDEIFDELRAVCQTILDTGQTSKVGKAALRAAQDANTRLTEIDLTTADPVTHTGIEKQLDEIIHRATAIQTKLRQIKTGETTVPQDREE